jgi:hypothetical protein
MNSRHGNVRSVANHLRRKDPGSHDSLSQRGGVRRDIKSRQATDDCESHLYLCRIADRGFVDNDLGNRALKLAMAIRPPLLGDLLVAGDLGLICVRSDHDDLAPRLPSRRAGTELRPLWGTRSRRFE